MDAAAERPISKKRKMDIDLEFREELLNNFKSLYEADVLCNVTLIAGLDGKKIRAHKAMLGAAVPSLRALFTKHNITMPTQISFDGIDGDSLGVIIDFCYSGSIDINESNVCRIMQTAACLEFTHIERKCHRFLSEIINITNCLLIWTSIDANRDFNKLKQTAKGNFVEVVKRHEYFLLDVQRLLELLQSDDLNIWSEEEVFNAAVNWIRYDEIARASHVKEILSTIRFPFLKLEFLSKTVTDFCVKFDCLDVIKDVYKWKLLPGSHAFSPRSSTMVNRWLAIDNSVTTVNKRCSEIYDVILNKWSNYNEMIIERDDFCVVLAEDDLFILGGQCWKEKICTNSVRKFNFTTKLWTDVMPMISERKKFAATVLNKEIYVAGGVDLESVEKFDIKMGEWQKMPPMLRKRSCFSLISWCGKLFAIGGLQQPQIYSPSVECYDSLERKWVHKGVMNRGRASHAAFIHNDRLYVVGGAPGHLEAEYYDPVTDKWTLVETLKISRFAFGLIHSGGDFIIIAGGRCAEHYYSSVTRIDLTTMKEHQIATMTMAKGHVMLIAMPRYNAAL